MKTINKTQQGFTLVELIIVIVILGILAVTAAPRFLNMSGEATRAVLTSVKSSLETGIRFTNNKALIQGKQNLEPSTTAEIMDTVKIIHGYPDATLNGVGSVLELPAGWVAVYHDTGAIGTDLSAADITAAGIKNISITPATTTAPAFVALAGVGVMRIAPSYADLKLAGGACYIEYKTAYKASATGPVSVPVINTDTTGCD